ncbi:MAG TPA: NAD(P)-binding oxidoreductase [Pseudonocardia sp.]|nr:NAD(P)-binding oxidoreductase [Pseudonocardia sp.]
MHVVIAGGHGKIGLRLATLLAARSDVVTGVVRNPAHVEDVERAGARAVVLDLEAASAEDLAVHLAGADAVVFAAGAGPGSGVARKDTVDRAAAELLAEAARLAGVRRYLLVSSTGVDTEPPPGTDEVWAAYLRAKKAAEEALRATDLDWTILRPGRLTDDPGTGRVLLSPPPVPRADVTRDDTAAVLVALLDAPGTAGLVLELREGEDDVVGAVAAMAGAGARAVAPEEVLSGAADDGDGEDR